MGVKATLDGRNLQGAPSWTFRAGTAPSTGTFDMDPNDVKQLMLGTLRPVELVITDGNQTLTVRKLFVVGEVAGPNPNVGRVMVADVRWFWERYHIRRGINFRRHIGVKRLESEGNLPVNMPVIDDVQYSPWSLNPPVAGVGKPWTAKELLEDLLKEVDRKIREGLQSDASSSKLKLETPTLDSVPIENLELDDTAAQAIGRVLSYLPEAQLMLDAEGTVRVYSRADGGDRAQIEAMGPEKIEGGHIQLIDNWRIRPSRVDVLFTREIEVRFNYQEPEGRVPVLDDERRLLENVMPVPDFQLRQFARGEWKPIPWFLFVWESAPGFGTLRMEDLRRCAVPFMDLWTGLRIAGSLQPDRDWASRISMLQQHYRTTFRINRRWMDKFYRLHETRVAMIDPETGTKAPALFYADHAMLNSQRSILADLYNGENVRYAINVRGSLRSVDAALDKSAVPAPARISIVDRDEGIIKVQFGTDETRLYEMVLPGLIDNNPTPEFPGFNAGQPIAFNALLSTAQASTPPQLKEGWIATTILSAIPAAPNTGEQLHRVPVRFNDVKDLLPPALSAGSAIGPPLEIRVSPSVETARFAWNDRYRNEIEMAFGLREGKPNLEPLLINGTGNAGDKSAPLSSVARAIAARVIAEFADRPVGSATYGFAPQARPMGFIESIRHGIMPTGEVGTDVNMAGGRPTLSLFSLMPPGVRAVVMKLAQPQR